MKFSVFVPGHITGFFTIFNNENFLKKGSCGGGILLDKGVITSISSLKNEDKLDIRINGNKILKEDLISKKVIELIKNDFNIEEGLRIDHKIELPTGCGFGVSASCALGIAISTYKFFNLPISYIEALQYAHKAEIILGSGLGDVIAETSRGIAIRTKPGAPGVGIVESIDFKEDISDIHLITKTLGEIPTKEIIEDKRFKNRINKYGLEAQKNFLAKITLENFMDSSYNFAMKTGLVNNEVLAIVKAMKENLLGASMAMLGNTAFGLSLDSSTDINGAIVSKIDTQGIKFL